MRRGSAPALTLRSTLPSWCTRTTAAGITPYDRESYSTSCPIRSAAPATEAAAAGAGAEAAGWARGCAGGATAAAAAAGDAAALKDLSMASATNMSSVARHSASDIAESGAANNTGSVPVTVTLDPAPPTDLPDPTSYLSPQRPDL